MLENTEGRIKNGQSSETGNIGTEDEEKHNKAQHSNGEHTIYYKTLVCIEWVTHMNLFSYRPTSVSL